MNVRSGLVFMLFVAMGASTFGAEVPEAIWWAPETQALHRMGRRPADSSLNPSSKSSGGHPHSGSAHRWKGRDEGLSSREAKESEASPRQRHDAAPHGMTEQMGQHRARSPHGRPEGARSGHGRGGGPSRGPQSAPGHSETSTADEGKFPSRAEILAAMRKPKPLLLRWGDFPAIGTKDSALGRLVTAENVRAWIRSSDGIVTQATLAGDQKTVTTKCPPDAEKGVAWPNGVYVVGMHLDAGVMDFDSDGKMERVHFYSNGLVSQFSINGTLGKEPGVFFKDAKTVALEIGPVSSSTGRGGMAATSQMALEENKLQVVYQGRPLAGAEVSVLSDSGWRNQVTTDAEGVLTVVPVGKKSTDGRMRMTPPNQCLYVVLHKEPKAGEYQGKPYSSEYHCDSLLLNVRMPSPEWTSKAEGFRLATISSMSFLVLVGACAIYRRRRRAQQVMVQFEQHRVGRD